MAQDEKAPTTETPKDPDLIVADNQQQATELPKEYAKSADFLEDETYDAVLRGKRIKLRRLGHLELLQMNVGYMEMLTYLDDIPEEQLAKDGDTQSKMLNFYGPIVCKAIISLNVVDKPHSECSEGEISIRTFGFDEVVTLGILVIDKSKRGGAIKEVFQKVAPLSEGDASETSTED